MRSPPASASLMHARIALTADSTSRSGRCSWRLASSAMSSDRVIIRFFIRAGRTTPHCIGHGGIAEMMPERRRVHPAEDPFTKPSRSNEPFCHQPPLPCARSGCERSGTSRPEPQSLLLNRSPDALHRGGQSDRLRPPATPLQPVSPLACARGLPNGSRAPRETSCFRPRLQEDSASARAWISRHVRWRRSARAALALRPRSVPGARGGDRMARR